MAEPIRTRELRTVAGRQICFDTEGFFWDPDDWSEDVPPRSSPARAASARLDDVQWRVLRFLRVVLRAATGGRR